MKKRIRIIFNPVSGIGFSDTKLQTLAQRFEHYGYDVEVLQTRTRGDARRFACDSDNAIYAITAVGGDGTINEVLNGLGQKMIPVGIVPRGTSNVLAKELGIPLDFKKACDVICRGKLMAMDLGRTSNNKAFALMAGVGIDADAVNYLDLNRRGNITVASYCVPVIKAVSRYRFPRMTVEVDGKVISREATVTFIGNVKGYYGPVRFTYLAKVDDGRFDICIIRAKSRIGIPKYIFGAVTRTLRSFADVIYVRGKEVKITSESDVLYQMDGDPGGRLPATFHTTPGAVKIFVP